MATRKNRPWDKEKADSVPSGGSWGSLPANLKPLADLPGELTPHRMGDIPVLVSVQNSDLGDFSDRVWAELDAKLLAAGGAMTVTRDELVKYFATAIYSRVMWVNRTMRPGTYRPSDKWALPVAFSMIVSAIGRVETTTGVNYVPVWQESAESIAMLLSKPEWEDVTRRLIALEPFGLRFVKAYETSEAGVEKVMSLLRVDATDDTFFYAWVPPHALETLIAAILGLRRSGDPVDILSLPKDAIPTYRIRGSWVLHFMHDFARLNEHRDVA